MNTTTLATTPPRAKPLRLLGTLEELLDGSPVVVLDGEDQLGPNVERRNDL